MFRLPDSVIVQECVKILGKIGVDDLGDLVAILLNVRCQIIQANRIVPIDFVNGKGLFDFVPDLHCLFLC